VVQLKNPVASQGVSSIYFTTADCIQAGFMHRQSSKNLLRLESIFSCPRHAAGCNLAGCSELVPFRLSHFLLVVASKPLHFLPAVQISFARALGELKTEQCVPETTEAEALSQRKHFIAALETGRHQRADFAAKRVLRQTVKSGPSAATSNSSAI
jgi:hypothetical protein